MTRLLLVKTILEPKLSLSEILVILGYVLSPKLIDPFLLKLALDCFFLIYLQFLQVLAQLVYLFGLFAQKALFLLFVCSVFKFFLLFLSFFLLLAHFQRKLRHPCLHLLPFIEGHRILVILQYTFSLNFLEYFLCMELLLFFRDQFKVIRIFVFLIDCLKIIKVAILLRD